MKVDDRVCSGWFTVEQGLCQGGVLVPLLFNICIAADINVAYKRFKADKDVMNALVHLREKAGAGGRGGATSGDPVLATSLWGMLCADDAGVVSQSPEQMKKMVGGIAGVWPHRIGGQY